MRNYQLSADSSRTFSALSRLCQAPVCWFSSGPAQKYILRQIRAVDQGLSKIGQNVTAGELSQLSVCLNMLYGSILFASTSYTFALSKDLPRLRPRETGNVAANFSVQDYFLRAHAIDPLNPAVCLSVGLSYIHYSIKRQCDNRQYLILQGFVFLFRYKSLRLTTRGLLGQIEADYNIGRAYHLLGLGHLAVRQYRKAMVRFQADDPKDMGQYEGMLSTNAQSMYNLKLLYLMQKGLF